MNRKTIKMLLAAIVASFAIASMAEAAPKKAVRHRVRHSSRVSSGAAATAGNRSTSKKQTTAASKKQTTAASKARRRAPAAKGKGALKKSTTGKSTAKAKPLTKPR